MVSDNKTSINAGSISVEWEKGLFSVAAYELVSSMLNGKAEIHPEEIQLEMANGDVCAIFISERLSCSPEFQKIWKGGDVVLKLRQLAKKALNPFEGDT